MALVLLAGCAGAQTSGSAIPGGLGTSGNARGTVSATVSGTLYVANATSVYAVPLGSNGAQTAQRTITPHPGQTAQTITGIAVNDDGTLDILQRYFNGPGQSQQHCRIVVESASADGSPAANNYQCDAADQTQSEQIARNYFGGFDVLITDVTTNKDLVRRWSADGTSVVNTLALDAFPLYFATDKGGHDYLDTVGGEIFSYRGSTTDPAQKVSDFSISAPNGLQQMAVAPDKTIYVVEGASGSEHIDAFAPGSQTVTRTIGPFSVQSVDALAVDSQGELYVALSNNGTVNSANTPAVVRVYDAAASGKPPPLRIITVQPNTFNITGLAVYEGPIGTGPIPTPTPVPTPIPTPAPAA